MNDMKKMNGMKEMKKTLLAVMCVFCLISISFVVWQWIGPGKSSLEPVVLTIWHNRSETRHAVSEAAEEFNRTVGKEKGIVLEVTSIGTSRVTHEKLEMVANGDPGAPEPPDIVITYPKTAILLARKDMLADIGSYFSEEELSAYVPRFLEEGRILNDGLYVFPTNKSTEALIVNRTLFDRFAAGTGVKFEDLATVEGLLRLAEEYYRWTDDQTPYVPDDGKMFFMIDNPYNFAQIAFRQLGEGFFSQEGKMNLSSPVFRKVWNVFYEPSVKGYEAIYDGYGTDLSKTGDLVCWTSSTAGITFLPTSMTYSDNTSEPVTFDLLPYPVFEGGKKIAVQRAAGFCLLKSVPEKERAAILFLKWLTAPEQNLNYLEGSGYLPVTREAIQKIVTDRPKDISPLRDRFLDIASLMDKEYDFFIPPLRDDYELLERRYESLLRKSSLSSRENFRKLKKTQGTDEAFNAAVNGVFVDFRKKLEADF